MKKSINSGTKFEDILNDRSSYREEFKLNFSTHRTTSSRSIINACKDGVYEVWDVFTR